jgi:membrane protein YdbS with pleckstrin-like domain
MLAGRPPFDGPNALAIANLHLHASKPALAADGVRVSLHVERAIERALSKDPAGRFPHAAAFAAALQPNTHAAGTDATAIRPLDGTALQPIDATAFHPLPVADGAGPDMTAIQPLSPQRSPAAASRGAHPAGLGDRSLILRRSARKTYALAVLLALAVGVVAYLARLTVSGYGLPSYPSAPYGVVPGLCALGLVISWLNTRSWLYTMDANAAVVQWGLLGHHRFGVPIRNITTLELKQSPIDRLLGVGTVELCARDQHGRERRVIMEDLPHPRETYDDLMRHLGRTPRARPAQPEADGQ